MTGWLGLAASGAHLRDARLFAVALLALVILLGWLWPQSAMHRRRLATIPIRIHIAGTRGKSTVTRMIAAGLRSGDVKTLAKTTGSEPRFIDPDGTDRVFPRRGPAAIVEQMRLVKEAARLQAKALVVECMAIRPEMIDASERHLIRATTLVITNLRPDHQEELGDAPDAMADAIKWALPAGGRVYMTDEAADPALLARARALNCAVTTVTATGLDPDSANRALALAVCEGHGISTQSAEAAIACAFPDPGHFTTTEIATPAGSCHIANAFACNDVTSLSRLWGASTDSGERIVLLNARRDRPLRTLAFLQFFASLPERPEIVLAGDPLARRLAKRLGLNAVSLRARDASGALDEISRHVKSGAVVWGIGNYRGMGADFADEIRRRAVAC